MKIFLVDYENTGKAGLDGIDTLGHKDIVDIFWGAVTKNVPFDIFSKISSSKASVKSYKCGKVAKNYLDFQIATFLGFEIGQYDQSELFIVSRDKDYESVVDFWWEKGYEINCCHSISEGCSEERDEEINLVQMIEMQEDMRQILSPNPNPVMFRTKRIGNKQETNKEKQELQKAGKKKHGKRLKKEWRIKLAQKMKSAGIKEDCYGKVFQIAKKSKSVGEYQRGLYKSLGQDKGTAVYTFTKGTFIEYLKRCRAK